MSELLGLAFMQRALIAGVLMALTAGYYGVFVVQRGLSFLGSGLAHAAFGGVALALLLNQEPLWVAVPFTVLVALLITWVRERSGLGADTVIGIFFALAMALGIVFLSRIPTYATDAFSILFGSILTVSWADVIAAAVVTGMASLTLPLWGNWAYATFDRESALADKLPVRRDDYLLSVLLAVTVVAAAKVVGIVLISAFLVIPAAAARLVTRRFSAMTLAAVGFGAVAALLGLTGSYFLDLPSGATIILLQCLGFAGCLSIAWLKNH
ncbi:metal ABC transporter permease [bacterium]|nr:metal ABC transporter permease [bacterium]